MRQFYLTYKIAKSPISQSLSWTHYIRLKGPGSQP